ncbi:MAG TPA: lysozyme inhibitor LprI family protein [Candidatus Baltobacteraceae bacterium]|nr:lysozyme inhibitor LprI family protein [Candidatus Baltobacteraceae bacterium]
MIGLLLAAALNCGSTATQVDLDFCAQAEQQRADRDERATLAARPREASLTEGLWRDERRRTCAYYYDAYRDGSMAPMLYSQCLAHSAEARTRDLRALRSGFPPGDGAKAIAEEQRVYGLLELLLTPHQRSLLAGSETAWVRYRRILCRHSANCNAQLAAFRTQELKDSWLAEPFW